MNTQSMADKNPAAVELGRLGGSKKSKRKRDAARKNGKKGGRPHTASGEQNVN